MLAESDGLGCSGDAKGREANRRHRSSNLPYDTRDVRLAQTPSPLAGVHHHGRDVAEERACDV